MWTRFGTTIVQPCEDGGESALVERLQSIGTQLPVKSVLIPCGDDYVLFLSRHRSELTPYYEFVIPDGQTVEMLVSKKSQYEHARKAGVPTPKTFLFTDDVEGNTLPYPCLLKPTYMHRWAKYQENMGIRNKTKVLVANAPEELAKHRPRIAESGLEWIAQELVEGSVDQLYAFYAYFDRDSTLLAAFVRRKLRQRPEFGAGCYSIGVREDEIVDLGARLLQPVGYRGLANIEFKRDAKDGQFKLIEINARSAAQASLPIDSGVDLPYIAYRDALRKPVQPVSSYRQGVKWVNLAGDFIAFLEHQRRGQLRLREWLSSLRDVRSYAYFAWDDPMPAVSPCPVTDSVATAEPSTGNRQPGA